MPRYTSLEKIQLDIKTGSTNCQELVAYYLSKIEETKSLNAYIEIFEEEAKIRAIELDKKYKENPNQIGRLFGMVISIKDVLCYKSHQVTAASKILEGFVSTYTATAVERLLTEDAIIIGRVNCDQFAMGSTNETSYYGVVKNAQDPSKVPGGSSGGSAVSVQADTCLCSIGSDTGGSVRQPAAFCGIVGMKPTYGRISRYGLLAYASSFDQIGVLTNSVKDAAILLETMAGGDNFDSTCSKKEVKAFSKKLDYQGKAKIAYFDTALEHKGIDETIKRKTFDCIDLLRKKGHEVKAVNFDYLDFIIPAYYVLTTAEASTNLSRYDGLRYGHRSDNAQNLLETYQQSRTEGFGEEVKRRIMLGTFVLSSGYYDAYYNKAQKVRRLIVERCNELFNEYDFILMPSSPVPVWALGEKLDDPVAMYLADIFTVLANMAGIPAISLPLGNKDEMPIGIQLMSNKFQEHQLFAFSQFLLDELLISTNDE